MLTRFYRQQLESYAEEASFVGKHFIQAALNEIDLLNKKCIANNIMFILFSLTALFATVFMIILYTRG